jgi:carboxylesterase
MGGAMTLKLAENFGGTSKEPDGIALIGTPVFLNDFKLGAIQKWGYYFMRIVALFTPALKPKVHKGSDKINDGEENWIGYSGSFVRGGVSLMYNLKEIRANLHLVETPIYIAHDQNDKTISFQNLPVIKERVSSKNIKEKITNLKSNHNRHTLLMYPSIQQQLSDEIVAFFKAIYEEKER